VSAWSRGGIARRLPGSGRYAEAQALPGLFKTGARGRKLAELADRDEQAGVRPRPGVDDSRRATARDLFA
jgi:hypothetical protein